jgi:hypothetical protein
VSGEGGREGQCVQVGQAWWCAHLCVSPPGVRRWASAGLARAPHAVLALACTAHRVLAAERLVLPVGPRLKGGVRDIIQVMPALAPAARLSEEGSRLEPACARRLHAYLPRHQRRQMSRRRGERGRAARRSERWGDAGPKAGVHKSRCAPGARSTLAAAHNLRHGTRTAREHDEHETRRERERWPGVRTMVCEHRTVGVPARTRKRVACGRGVTPWCVK